MLLTSCKAVAKLSPTQTSSMGPGRALSSSIVVLKTRCGNLQWWHNQDLITSLKRGSTKEYRCGHVVVSWRANLAGLVQTDPQYDDSFVL